MRQRAHRHHRARGVSDIDIVDIVDRLSIRRLGLDIHLPGAAKNIEVVDVITAERRLQRIEDVADLDAKHLCLVAIDVEEDLRRVGGEGAEHTREFRLLVGADQHAAHRGGDVGRRLALKGLEHILEAAGISETKDRGQVEGENDRLLDRRELRPQLLNDRARALRRIASFLIGLEANDEERLVGCGETIDEVVAHDRQHALTPATGLMISSTCFTTFSVRLIEAPSGRRMAAKKAP